MRALFLSLFIACASHADNRIIWKFNSSSRTSGYYQPVLSEDKSIYLSSDNYVFKLFLNGKLQWKHYSEDSIYAGVLLSYKSAYYTTKSSYLNAISIKDGHSIWKVKLGDALFGMPIYTDFGIAVASDLGDVILLSNDGSVLWRTRLNSSDKIVINPSRLSIVRKSLLYSSSDGSIYLLDAKTGKLLTSIVLSVEKDANIMGPAQVLGDNICSSSYSNGALCYSFLNNIVLWRVEDDKSSSQGLLVGDGYYLPSYYGRLIKYDTTNGAILWSNILLDYKYNGKLGIPIHLSSGNILIPDTRSNIYILDYNNGHLLSKFTVNNVYAIISKALAIGSRVLIQDIYGNAVYLKI